MKQQYKQRRRRRLVPITHPITIPATAPGDTSEELPPTALFPAPPAVDALDPPVDDDDGTGADVDEEDDD